MILHCKQPDRKQSFLLTHLEYVYDNTIAPVTNIYKGMRYKVYADVNTNLKKDTTGRQR